MQTPTISSSVRAIGLIAVASALAGCRQFFGVGACTTEALPAVRIEVRDSVSNSLVANGGRAIVRDGEFADTAEVFDGMAFPLALERAGTYTVTVEKDGYRLWSRGGVRVTDGECHVRTVGLVARLQP